MGQGSTAAGASCTTMTIPVLRTDDKLANRLSFSSPNQAIHYANKATMYVDDTTKYTNNFPTWIHQQPTPLEVAALLKSDAQTWERCLWTSNRLLKLTKCLYYLMHWKFKPNDS